MRRSIVSDVHCRAASEAAVNFSYTGKNLDLPDFVRLPLDHDASRSCNHTALRHWFHNDTFCITWRHILDFRSHASLPVSRPQGSWASKQARPSNWSRTTNWDTSSESRERFGHLQTLYVHDSGAWKRKWKHQLWRMPLPPPSHRGLNLFCRGTFLACFVYAFLFFSIHDCLLKISATRLLAAPFSEHLRRYTGLHRTFPAPLF